MYRGRILVVVVLPVVLSSFLVFVLNFMKTFRVSMRNAFYLFFLAFAVNDFDTVVTVMVIVSNITYVCMYVISDHFIPHVL